MAGLPSDEKTRLDPLDRLSDQIFAHKVKANGGVLLAAKEILEIACERQVDLQWVDGACQVQIYDLGVTRRAMPNSYFRALLARLSTLFSEATSKSSNWNLYQGQGRLMINMANAQERIIEMTFENTQQRQFASMRAVT
jgi:hypothetical protein